MAPPEFRAAVHAAGVPKDARVEEIDRAVAQMLLVSERTARRYRTGKTPIPGPAVVALRCLIESHGGRACS